MNIERLRAGVLIVAVLLVVAVAGFLGYARYRTRNILRDLPHRLGMQIQQSADGFTYSQSHGGHTLFTLHASKVIQYKDKGRASLHDVSILLYGADGKRADRISGQDFDYDPSSGIAQAQGEVEIDLENPNKQQQSSPGTEKAGAGTNGGGSIRVKTSGLTFNQKTGLAATTQNVEFQFPQASGKATGASYDSQRGVLMLDHAVEIDSTDTDGNLLVVHAGNAQIVRDSHQGFFDQIACAYRGDQMSADHATLLFRDDGSAQQINADGRIHLQTDTGTVVDSKSGVMQMDGHSQPLKANLNGGVAFHSYDARRKLNGNAGEGLLTFGEKGALRHATLSSLVSLVDSQSGLPGDPGGTSTRQVQSQQLDLDFTTTGFPATDLTTDRTLQPARQQAGQHTELKAALAQGGAKAALRTNPTKGAKQDTAISADRLLANFAEGSTITLVTGSGHTRLTDIAANGVTQTSTGDNLAVKFVPVRKTGQLEMQVQRRPGGKAIAASPADTAAEIESAIQQGNVTMEQSAAASTAPATVSADAVGAAAFKATAQKATYTGESHMLHLEGSPRVTDGALDLTSNTLDYSRITGDAVANGDVKATYIRPSGGAGSAQPGRNNSVPGKGQDPQRPQQGLLAGTGPAHIIAGQATLVHTTGDAVFRGQARLWQGTDSIAAPVIELSRSHQTLKAHGETETGPANGPAAVNAALVSSTGTAGLLGSGGTGKSSGPAGATGSARPNGSGGSRPPGLVRIRSQQMTYSDGERKASFQGSVVAEDGAETVRADAAEVFLVPATNVPGKKGNTGSTSPGGSLVDHMLATGHVVLQQPGRKGTGDKLVYGAQDGNFILTGTAAMRPTMSDAQHGNVTGDALIFNSRDDSVTVSGGSSGTATQTRSPH